MANEYLSDFDKDLRSAVASRKHIILDLVKLTFLTSSALSLFLRYNNMMRSENLFFILLGLQEDLKKIFEITQVDRHLTLCDDYAQAEKLIGGGGTPD